MFQARSVAARQPESTHTVRSYCFFATLECELIARRSFQTRTKARMAIFEFIEGWYNTVGAIPHGGT